MNQQKYSTNLNRSKSSGSYLPTINDLRHEAIGEMQRNGHELNELIADGAVHRCGPKDAQWYVAFENIFHGKPFLNVTYGDWRTDIKRQFRSSATDFSGAEIEVIERQIQEAKRKADEQRKAVQKEAALQAEKIWAGLDTAGISGYLTIKGFDSRDLFGCRIGSDCLWVPLRDKEGNLCSLQQIEADGQKLFLRGGRISGCFHVIGEVTDDDIIYVVEGLATGGTIRKATNKPTVVAFNAGNLKPVCEILREKYPNQSIVICGDDDRWTNGNPGETKANEAAKFVGAAVVFPKFKNLDNKPTDFNDLFLKEGINEVGRQVDSVVTLNEEPWPRRETLPPVLPVAPKLDLDHARAMLPEALQGWVLDFAHRAQVPIESVAVACLGSIASVVGRKIGIYPKQKDNYWVPCVFWTAIVARPGERKSSIISYAQRPLNKLESEALDEFKAAIAENGAKREVVEQRINAIKDQLKTAAKSNESAKISKLENELRELLANRDANVVYQKRYRTNDATVEMLQVLLKGNPNGILVPRDELIGLFRSFEKTGHETDRSFFLEGWDANGAPYTVDRIGRGTTTVESLCLHILGGIQPGKLQEFVRQAVDGGGDDDGLLQRVQLMVYPEPVTDVKWVDQAPDSSIFDEVEKVFKFLSDLKVDSGGNKRKGLRFAPEAQELYQMWSLEIERRYRLGLDEHPAFVSHLSKYQRLMPALALLFQLINDASKSGHIGDPTEKDISEQVGLRQTEMAAAWCEFLEAHARKVYAIVENRELRDATALLRRIEKGDVTDELEVREIAKKGWAPFAHDADAISRAIEMLEQYGHARIERRKPKTGRPRVVIRIHPELRNRG